jgi:hypothetical protein
MSLSQYLLGAAELAVIATALGLGAYHVRALLVPAWTGALARLAEIVLGLSALIVISEFLGVLRLLEEVPLVIACVGVGLGAAMWARPRHEPRGPGEFPAVHASRAMFAVAVATSALVVVHWSMPTQESLDVGMYYQDTTWYHMSFSGRFAQTGEVGPLHFTDPLALTAWFYPQNSELLHAIPMVALDNDFFSPVINLSFLALSLLAAWCIGRPYAIGAVTLVGAAVVLDSEMIVASQAGNAPNDIMGLFFLLAVLAFLVNGAATARAAPQIAGASGETADPPLPRAADGEPGFDPEADEEHPQEGVVEEVPVAGDPRVLAGVGAGPLLLAGLAAGLGVGTKITLLATLGALTVGLAILAGRERWIRAMSIWLGAMLLTGGFWYLRNIWHSLNPFPQVDSIGGFNLPGPDQPGFYPREPHSLVEYYNDPTVWKSYFFPILDDRLGPMWPLILVFAFGGLALGVLWARSSLLRLLAITGLFAGIAYGFTPLTASGGLGQPTGFDANLRYVAPALIIGFTIVPLIPRLRRSPWPWAFIGLFAFLILQGNLRVQLEWFPLELSTSWRFGHYGAAILLGLLVVGIPAALVWAARAGVRRTLLIAATVLAFVLVVGLGRSQQEVYMDDRYRANVAPELGSGFRSTPEWTPMQIFAKESEDLRIGVVGRASAFGQYFFYGDDLSNRVQYLGRELRRGTYRQIDRCDDLRRAINDGNYDYVVVTPRIRDEEDDPPENMWVGADLGVTEVVRSGPARIYRVDGAMDPSTCRYLGKEQTT